MSERESQKAEVEPAPERERELQKLLASITPNPAEQDSIRQALRKMREAHRVGSK